MGKFSEKIRNLSKSITFWLIIGFSIIWYVGYEFDFLEELWLIISIPMAILMMSLLPGISVHVQSVRIARMLLPIHKNIINLRVRKNIFYKTDENFTEKQSMWNFAKYNTWYCAGIAFLFLIFSGIEITEGQRIIQFVVASAFFGIIFGSGLNFAIFLIKKRGIFAINKKDGSKINLGSEWRAIINGVLGPLQIIVFIVDVIIEGNYISFFISLGLILLICFVASITSYLIMKKNQYTEKLYAHFVEKCQID